MHCCLACEQLTFFDKVCLQVWDVKISKSLRYREVPLESGYLPKCLALHGFKGVCQCLIVMMPVHCTALQQTYLVGYVLCMEWLRNYGGMPMCRQKSRDIEVDLWRFAVSSKT